MKKILVFLVAITTVLVIAGCGQIQDAMNTQKSSASSLATLSYLSSSFLDTSVEEEPTASNFFKMNEEVTTDLTEFESEIDEVNVYLDKLKVFIEEGTNTFGQVEVQESDHAVYGNKMTFTINEDEYILYYDINLSDGSIVGEFVIGDTIYEIEGYTNFDDIEEIDVDEDDEADLDDEDEDDEADLDDEDEDEADLDDEDEDEETDLDDEDEDEEENEEKMVLIARNGDDVIQITYKVETEDDEYEAKFEMEQTINGVYKEISMKIEQEENEYKIEIEDGENTYTIKRELEDDNEIEYKLEYEVNGVQGEVKVTETTNEAGETIYTYEIEEDGKSVEREIEDPDNDDDDDDEEDEDDEEEDDSSESTDL